MNERNEESRSSFAGLQLPIGLAQELSRRGIAQPTPIQARAVPVLAAGRDALVHAQTGTGKTLAYLLPLLAAVDPESKHVQAVIVAPTQELAMQIYREAEACAGHYGLNATALIGGASVQRQIDRLKLRPQIVVGTPGRLVELIKMRKLNMHEVRTMVLDEADDVFALENGADAEALIRSTRRDRQLAFVSATGSARMLEAAERWMHDPAHVDLSSAGLPGALTHYYYVCQRRDKIDALRRWLRLFDPPSALVFVNDTDSIAEIAGKLAFKGLSVEAVYGDAGKTERARTMQRFKSGAARVLVATDVAARGMDIPGLTHVLQFDPAADADHYVHRAGRTGRMGAAGTVMTIVTPDQRFIMEKFAKKLGIALTEADMKDGRMVAPARARGAGKQPAEAPRTREEKRMEKTAGRSSAAADTRAAERHPGAKPAGKARPPRAKDTKNKGAPRWLKEKAKQDPKPD